jgi:hypothetical protein
MVGHDGIGRDRSLEIASRMRAAADDRVGVDRPVRVARGRCVRLPGFRDRCRGRGATRSDLVSMSIENDRGRSQRDEAERRSSHEPQPRAAP